MILTVKEIINETEDSVSVIFKTNIFNKIRYKSGQFLTVKIPINNKIEKRAYSFSSSPVSDKFPKITVKKVKKGLVSNYLCNKLKIGQKIEVEKPAGSFFIEPNVKASNQYVFFAAGSGITPIFSISKTILEKEPLSQVLLIYANRNKESIIFKKALEDISEKYPENFFTEHVLEKNTSSKPNYHQDLINDELVDYLFTKHKYDYQNCKIMMCGPQGFMNSAKEILYKKNVTRDKIKVEAFRNSLITANDSKNLTSTVVIYKDNKKQIVEIPGDKTILQGAMANNIVLPYSCRSGMCSSCKAKCVNGKVKMIDGHFLSPQEVDEGYILTCISFPTTNNVAVSYLND